MHGMSWNKQCWLLFEIMLVQRLNREHFQPELETGFAVIATFCYQKENYQIQSNLRRPIAQLKAWQLDTSLVLHKASPPFSAEVGSVYSLVNASDALHSVIKLITASRLRTDTITMALSPEMLELGAFSLCPYLFSVFLLLLCCFEQNMCQMFLPALCDVLYTQTSEPGPGYVARSQLSKICLHNLFHQTFIHTHTLPDLVLWHIGVIGSTLCDFEKNQMSACPVLVVLSCCVTSGLPKSQFSSQLCSTWRDERDRVWAQ